MTFDERKNTAKKLVAEFLRDYVAPRGLDDPALANRISLIADAFARRMPTKGDYDEGVGKVLMGLRDTHVSNTWPTQAAFVSAMPAGENRKFAPIQQYDVNRREDLQRLMTDGEAVAEVDIWGPIANSISLPTGVLESYRKASAARHQKTYRHNAHRIMRQKYGPEVDLYFRAPKRMEAGE